MKFHYLNKKSWKIDNSDVIEMKLDPYFFRLRYGYQLIKQMEKL